MKKENILVDCDGVIADCLGFITEHLSNKYNIDYSTQEYQKKDFREWPEYTKEDEEYFQSSGICLKFKPIIGAENFIKELNERFEVIYCTSPYRGSVTWPYDRTKWLKQCFDVERKNIIFAATGMKKFVSGATLIDDSEKNATTWSAHNRRDSILMNQPWNEDFRNSKDHASFTSALTNTLHLTGLKEEYGINCANSYEEILSIIDNSILLHKKPFVDQKI